MRIAVATLFVLGLPTSAASVAMAQPVAVVVSVEGIAQVSLASASTPVAMLQLLFTGHVLGLDGSGKVVVLYLATGHEYSLIGPARVRIDAKSVSVLEGRGASLRVPPPEKIVHLRPERIVQAGMVMRAGAVSPSGAAAAAGRANPNELELRRPAPGASVAERAAYGLWLEHVGAMIEARAVWRELAAEMQDQAGLSSRTR